MESRPGVNEGMRILEDFVCDAVPAPNLVVGGSPGAGRNMGIDLVAELVTSNPPVPLDEERRIQLRALSHADLLALVRQHNVELSPEELLFIHDLAIESLAGAASPCPPGADQLPRELMRLALRRLG